MSLKEFDQSNSAISGLGQSGDIAFLNFFETYLSDTLDSLDQPVRDLARKVVLGGGKRIRPLLVFRCGSGFREVTEDLLKVSAILELVHVATLVHDDILDEAKIRRSHATVHTQIGEHNAILLGDALFSFALELATEFPSTRICKLVSSATRRTCTGEIMQTFARGNFEITLSDYFSFIQDKTGELFKASCQAGAFLAGHTEHVIDLVGGFGLSLGLNYQIFDDLIDSFGESNVVGKCLGTDFDSGKVTLPTILLFQKLSSSQNREIKDLLGGVDSISDFSRQKIGDLMVELEIREECIVFLRQKLSQTRLIASNLPYEDMSSNLLNFLALFDEKLSSLSGDAFPNFLALDK
ncbi:MAG: polyprenyl synthetase family protein [Opitutae bacterium]|jgi:octaprenyl-diphosphate synthase|nr:polyprenyl synthetase family protein [Opitutae bacterium]